MKKLVSQLKKNAIQIAIFLLCLMLVEGGARIWEHWLKEPQQSFGLNVVPYVMFSGSKGGGHEWYNQISKQKIPSNIVFNNFGSPEAYDFQMMPDAQYLAQYAKKPDEILVLLAGGSTVNGVGATGNDKTISAQMQRYLNARSQGKRYRVINMGMGGWIAYQEFVGLSIFGAPLNPDWVVVMDGMNDGAVPCGSGSGAGNPQEWPKLIQALHGAAGQTNPLLLSLSKHSALIRGMFNLDASSKQALPTALEQDESVSDHRFATRMAGLKVGIQDEQMRFYLQAEHNILHLFHRANVLFSTVPAMYDNGITLNYRRVFGMNGTADDMKNLQADIHNYMKDNRDKKCSLDKGPQLNGYSIALSALKLKQMAEEEQRKDTARHILYYNAEATMPYEPERRAHFFLDNGHMMDDGQERVGEFFADAILAAENKKAFDYKAFVAKHKD